MVRSRWWLWMALVAVGTSALAAAPSEMSVQVKNGQLRASPSFLGKVIDPVAYGDRVTVVQQQGDWIKIGAPGGKTGWIHQSALTPKRIVVKAGSGDVQTGASGSELALAGKGFNSDVEAEFKANNQDVDFTWVDKMEKMKVSAEESAAFLKQGGVSPAKGGGQ